MIIDEGEERIQNVVIQAQNVEDALFGLQIIKQREKMDSLAASDPL